ncbi:MAG: bifunctional ADP-dependent NAD(P)H-hydrate dehydratase/NAD(P)H-hydrate epimerase, partial [Phototrophicales bacterium]
MDRHAVTAEQIRQIDRMAIEEYGIPGIILMENAGRAVSQEIRRLFKTRHLKSTTIVCGPGNNGGDGLVVARLLLNAGFHTHVY